MEIETNYEYHLKDLKNDNPEMMYVIEGFDKFGFTILDASDGFKGFIGLGPIPASISVYTTSNEPYIRSDLLSVLDKIDNSIVEYDVYDNNGIDIIMNREMLLPKDRKDFIKNRVVFIQEVYKLMLLLDKTMHHTRNKLSKELKFKMMTELNLICD